MNPELDEYGWEQLVNELSRRGYSMQCGICPYCKKKLVDGGKNQYGKQKYLCTCKFGDRISFLWADHALSRWQNRD